MSSRRRLMQRAMQKQISYTDRGSHNADSKLISEIDLTKQLGFFLTHIMIPMTA